MSYFPVGFINPLPLTEINFLQNTHSESDLSSYTFSNQNLGAADGRRWIIVVASFRSAAGAGTANGCSIAGIAATKLVEARESTNGTSSCAIWIAYVPTGTTGDIVVSFSSAYSRGGIGVYRCLQGQKAPNSPYTTNTDVIMASNQLSASVNVPRNGIVVAGMYANASSGTVSTTWSGVTEKYDQNFAETTGGGYTGGLQAYKSEQVGLSITGTIAPASAGFSALAVAVFA